MGLKDKHAEPLPVTRIERYQSPDHLPAVSINAALLEVGTTASTSMSAVALSRQ